MQSIKNGITNLFQSYADGDKETTVLVVKGQQLEDTPSEALLDMVVTRLGELSKSVTLVTEKDWLDGSVDGFEEFNRADVVFLFSKTKSIFRAPILQYLQDRICAPKILRVFDFSPELFAQTLLQTQYELDSLNKLVIAAGVNTESIIIKSESGTDLVVELQPGYEWTNSCGHFNGSYPGVFPPGEVNTFSTSVNGTLVCDGAVNSSIGFPGSVLLDRAPLSLQITDGVVTDFACDNDLVSLFLGKWATIENSLRVGEIGFGTNYGCTKFVDVCSHINERHPGLHLGLGMPTQSAKTLPWSCKAHLDVIPADTSIYFDDTLVFHKQRYLTDNLTTKIGSNTAIKVLDVDAI